MKKEVNIAAISIFWMAIFGLPIFLAWAQDGSSIIRDEPSALPAAREIAPSTPRAIEQSLPAPHIPREQAGEPAPATSTSVQTATQETSSPGKELKSVEENFSSNFFGIAALVFAAIVAGYGVFKLKTKNKIGNKSKEKQEKNNSRCFDIKKLMGEKLKELTDLKGRVESHAKEKARGKIKEITQGTPLEETSRRIERAEKEYERLKELYEKCVIEFQKNKQVFIIHGCPSDAEKAMNPETRTYDKHWIPWIKKELIAKGIPTEAPLMPSPWEPDYEKFRKEFEKYKITENAILIGHSCGCAFLVRWLGETKKKIAMLILVAPWKIPDGNDPSRKTFYTYPIDKTITSRVEEIVMFTSDNEEEKGKESLGIFHKALGGKIIVLKGRGHYTMDDMDKEEFPELLEVILK